MSCVTNWHTGHLIQPGCPSIGCMTESSLKQRTSRMVILIIYHPAHRGGMSCALLRLCDCSRDSDYLDAQLKEANVEFARNLLFQFPAQFVHLFLVKPRCVPLNGDSHRSRNDQCQVVPQPQPRLDFAVVLVRHVLDFHHTASSFASAISSSVSRGITTNHGRRSARTARASLPSSQS